MTIPASRNNEPAPGSAAQISPARMRDLIRHWYEDVLSGTIAKSGHSRAGAWDDADINLGKLFAPDFLNHVTPAPPGGWKRGVAAAQQMIRSYRLAFPDLTLNVDELLVDGDKVTVRYTVEGTHTASQFLNMPATAKHYKISGISIYRIENGKIAESWGLWDVYSLMLQMGHLPATFQPRA